MDPAVRSTQQIERHEVKGGIRVPQSSTLPRAFGRQSFPEIGKALDSKEGDLRVQGLTMLKGMLSRASNAILAVKNGLLKRIESNLDCAEALECVVLLVRQRYSRVEMLKNTGMVPALLEIAASGKTAGRVGAFQALREFALNQGLDESTKERIIKLCIDRGTADTEPAVQAKALQVLQKMIMNQGVAQRALAGVPGVIKQLDSKDAGVRAAACEVLTYAALSQKGKELCIEEKAVPKLAVCLDDADRNVRHFAASTLMRVATLKSGKIAMIDADAISVVAKRLDDLPAIQNYALQLICNIGEHPKVRSGPLGSKEIIAKIEALKNGNDPVVAGSAQSALDVLLWVP